MNKKAVKMSQEELTNKTIRRIYNRGKIKGYVSPEYIEKTIKNKNIPREKVEEILEVFKKEEIKVIDKPTVMVFNKIDAYKPQPYDEIDLTKQRTKSNYSLKEWEDTWMSKLGKKTLFISALNKQNLESFKRHIYSEVRKIHISRFPYNHFLYPDYD